MCPLMRDRKSEKPREREKKKLGEKRDKKTGFCRVFFKVYTENQGI